MLVHPENATDLYGPGKKAPDDDGSHRTGASRFPHPVHNVPVALSQEMLYELRRTGATKYQA